MLSFFKNVISIVYYFFKTWVLSTDHKKIGIMYLIMGFFFGSVGLWLSFFIRLELMNPLNQLFSGSVESYQISITLHGIIMIFFSITPILLNGLGNYFIPLMIGSPDMAFPKMNNLSLWLFFSSFIVLSISSGIFTNTIGPGFGWTLYPPLSIINKENLSIDCLVIALHMNGLATLLNAINTITTIQFFSSISIWNMPVFIWGVFFSSYLLLLVIPVLVAAITLLLTDHILSTCFYTITGGGDPILFQHLFWFFGHPEVYILMLPAFGLVSDFIVYYGNKSLFGKNSMFWSMFSISFLGMLVWGHHMFTAGLEIDTKCYFTLATMIISVPTGLKVFSWLLSLLQGEIRKTIPIICVLLFITTFVFGGISGMVLAQAGIDLCLHDTYYVVGHFHYMLALCLGYIIFACIYHWFYFFTCLQYNRYFAKLHICLFTLGSNMIFLPMHFLGICGLQRRILDYPSCFNFWQSISTYGMLITFSSFIWLILSLCYFIIKPSNRYKNKRVKENYYIYFNKFNNYFSKIIILSILNLIRIFKLIYTFIKKNITTIVVLFTILVIFTLVMYFFLYIFNLYKVVNSNLLLKNFTKLAFKLLMVLTKLLWFTWCFFFLVGLLYYFVNLKFELFTFKDSLYIITCGLIVNIAILQSFYFLFILVKYVIMPSIMYSMLIVIKFSDIYYAGWWKINYQHIFCLTCNETYLCKNFFMWINFNNCYINQEFQSLLYSLKNMFKDIIWIKTNNSYIKEADLKNPLQQSQWCIYNTRLFLENTSTVVDLNYVEEIKNIILKINNTLSSKHMTTIQNYIYLLLVEENNFNLNCDIFESVKGSDSSNLKYQKPIQLYPPYITICAKCLLQVRNEKIVSYCNLFFEEHNIDNLIHDKYILNYIKRNVFFIVMEQENDKFVNGIISCIKNYKDIISND